jgi:ATP-dependent Lon protease
LIVTGSGKHKPAGGITGAMKKSIQRAFAYMQDNKSALSVSHEADSYDYNVEAIDLLGNQGGSEVEVDLPHCRLLSNPPRTSQSRHAGD